MSDLNSKMEEYRGYIASGMSARLAAKSAGISPEDAVRLGKLSVGAFVPTPEKLRAGQVTRDLVGRGILRPEIGKSPDTLDMIERGLGEEEPSQFQSWVAESTSIASHIDMAWQTTTKIAKKVGSGAIKSLGVMAETFSVPQQLMLRGIIDLGTDEDPNYAAAIPTWMRNDESDKETPHEFLTTLGALNKLEGLDPLVMDYEEFKEWKENAETDVFFKIPGSDREVTNKTLANVGYFLGNIAVDVATDPLTYVAGLGLVGKGVNALRKTLPVAIRAGALEKIAMKSMKIDDLAAAHKEMLKVRTDVVTKVNAGKITSEKAADQLRWVTKSINQLDDELAVRGIGDTAKLTADQVEYMASNVPHARPAAMKKGGSPLRDAIIDERKAALDDGFVRSVSPNQIEDTRDQITRVVKGYDDYEEAAQVAARQSVGATNDDVAMRFRTPINGVETSTNIKPMHVGKDGYITQDGQFLDTVTRTVTGLQDNLLNAHEKTLGIIKAGKTAVKEMGDATKIKGLAKAEMEIALEGEAKWAAETTRRVKDLSKLLASTRTTGKIPKNLLKYDAQWPSSPRRELLDSSKFIDDTFGNKAGAMFAKGLYPKTVIPRPAFVALNRAFGETWRVLDKYAPDIGKRVFGGMQNYDTEIASNVGRISRIFNEMGVVAKHQSKKRRVAQEFTGARFTEKEVINKELSKRAYDMLDNKVGSDVWNDLAEGMSPEFMKGVTQIRGFLDDMSGRLGLSADDSIDGYISHIREFDHFNGGSVPLAFEGTSAKQRIPAFLKTRTGNDAERIDDIVEVMDYYTRATAHELHIRPMFKEIELTAARIANETVDGSMNWLPGYANIVASRLQGKPSMMRKYLDRVLPPGYTRLSNTAAMGMSMSAYSSVLVGGPRYWLMSVSQAVNSAVPQYGVMNTLKGAMKSMSAEGRYLTRKMGLAEEHKAIHEGIKSKITGLAGDIRAGGPSIRDAESFIRGISLHAGIGERMARMGFKSIDDIPPALLNEMTWEATRDAKHLSHVFGWLGKPQWFDEASRSGSSVLAQFTSFPFKQSATIWENSMRNPGYLADYIMYAGWMTKTADEFGVDLEPHVGMPEFNDPTSPQTIVVKAIAATINYTSVGFFEDSPMVIDRKKKEFYAAIENMIPLATLKRRSALAVKAIQDHPRAATYDSQGRKIRDLNTGLFPADGGATDLISAVTFMNSSAQRVHRKRTEAFRLKRDERMIRTIKLSEEFHKAVEDGRTPDPKTLNKLTRELAAMGVTITAKQMAEMSRDARKSVLLPVLIRRAQDNLWNASIIHETDTSGRKINR